VARLRPWLRCNGLVNLDGQAQRPDHKAQPPPPSSSHVLLQLAVIMATSGCCRKYGEASWNMLASVIMRRYRGPSPPAW
jgi:hypothetical protein